MSPRSNLWRPAALLLVAALATVAALPLAIDLELETDLTKLLPEDAPAARDYRAFAERFGGFDRVYVLLSSPGEGEPRRGALAEAAERFARRLEASPAVARTRSGLEESDLDYLVTAVVPRAALLREGDWLSHTRRALEPSSIERRVEAIRQRVSAPVSAFERRLLAHDPLGLAADLPALHTGGRSLPIDPITGSFLSRDGTTALVVVEPAVGEIDPAGGRALERALAEAFDELGDLPAGVENLAWSAVGGALYAAEDERLVRRDLERSLTSSALLCSLLLLATFGGARLPATALAVVGVGLLWTGAATSLSLGRVTAVAIGFSTVLLGLGIDYAIHGITRYRDGLEAGLSRAAAVANAARRSGAGIVVSALTTAAAFAVLRAAHFVPLRDLGGLVAIGVIAILLATASLGVGLLSLGSAPIAGRRAGPLWRPLGGAVERASRFATARPRLVLAIATIWSVSAATGLRSIAIDPSLEVFRSEDHGAIAVERRLADRFGLGLEAVQVVVESSTLQGAIGDARRIAELASAVERSPVAVSSPAELIVDPVAANERLRELEKLPFEAAIESFRAAALSAGLAPRFFEPGFETLRRLAEGRDPAPAALDEAPDWISERIHRGKTISLALQLETRDREGEPPEELLERIEREVSSARIASTHRLGHELRELAHHDLRRLAGLAALVVVAVVLASFRGRPRPTALALVPVALGSLWSLGLWGLAGGAIDLVTLAVLPIVFGLGIDDGLHALHAWRLSPERGLDGAIRESGRAILLTTLTTATAFASLALTSVPGLRRAGLLTALGVTCCLLVTLFVLPALSGLRRDRPLERPT